MRTSRTSRRRQEGCGSRHVAPTSVHSRSWARARSYARRVAVLGTKIRIPDAGRDQVPRRRLTDRLGTGALSRPRLVLVSAPPGFGKTTILSQWLTGSSEGAPAVAWLSLDEGDNDPRRFLTHLVAALRTPGDVGAEAAQLLDTAAEPPVEAVLTSIVNDLDEHEQRAVVVLDDYHVIESPEVHRAVSFLLDHLPPHAGLAIATRADPPLPLPRLRARGELVEIRAADLRFTPGETDAFLTEVMGLHLTPDQTSALGMRTEGWVAGLQLAGLALRGVEDTDRFVESFTGSHRFVLDYLVDEVLRRQPPHVRRFLLDTAVLRELTGPLCDAVTGRADGRDIIELLDRTNLFVVALDDRREWYRYHHLFADALRARLTAEEPDRAHELHRAASEWYAAHDRPEAAVRHALAGGEAERAADLIEVAVVDVRRLRQDRLLRAWLTSLPEDTVRRRPLLSVVMAWTRLLEGDLDGVEAWLSSAEAALAEEPPPHVMPSPDSARADDLRSLRATIAMYRAAAAQARDDVAATALHARETMSLAGPEDHFARGAAAGFLGLAAWARGDLADAVTTFTQAVDSLRAAGHVTDALGGTVVLGGLWIARGRPRTTQRLHEQALDEASRDPGARLSIGRDLHVGLAEALLEQGELEAAEEQLRAGQALGDTASLLENRHRWFVVTARLRWAQGDADAAVRLLDEAEPLYLRGFFPDVRPIAALRARVRIAQGRLADAEAWAQRRGVRETEHAAYLDEFDQLTLVRLLLAQHRADRDPAPLTDAAHRLDRLLAAAQGAAREGSVVEIRMLRALAHHALGDLDLALGELGTALELAVPAGFVRMFLDEGAPMDELLRAAETRPSLGKLARSVSPAAYGIAPGTTVPGGLSEREVDVLRLLATTLTGPEISRELYVSLNTLRTHTKHIFTKLDVTSRRAAVRRATELGLL